jgi:hypothetical protein
MVCLLDFRSPIGGTVLARPNLGLMLRVRREGFQGTNDLTFASNGG